MCIFFCSDSKTNGQIVDEFAAVACEVWSGKYKYISPTDLRFVIGDCQHTFRGSQQQDSHEFLTIFMDLLHLELLTIRTVSNGTIYIYSRIWHFEWNQIFFCIHSQPERKICWHRNGLGLILPNKRKAKFCNYFTARLKAPSNVRCARLRVHHMRHSLISV